MKTMKIYGTEIVAKCNNQREEKLVRIINAELEHMVKERCYDWAVEQLCGELCALFYLDIIAEPVSLSLSFNKLFVGSKDYNTVLTVKAA